MTAWLSLLVSSCTLLGLGGRCFAAERRCEALPRELPQAWPLQLSPSSTVHCLALSLSSIGGGSDEHERHYHILGAEGTAESQMPELDAQFHAGALSLPAGEQRRGIL